MTKLTIKLDKDLRFEMFSLSNMTLLVILTAIFYTARAHGRKSTKILRHKHPKINQSLTYSVQLTLPLELL